MVEEMYLEEFKDHHDGGVWVGADRNDEFLNQNLSRNEDQKPTHDQLVRIHSESPSSMLNNPEKNGGKRNKTLENEVKNHCFGGVGDSFGAIELDFSSYPYPSAAAGGGTITPSVSYGGGGGGGGVSLTLGLYQHGLQRNMMGAQLLHDLAG